MNKEEKNPEIGKAIKVKLLKKTFVPTSE